MLGEQLTSVTIDIRSVTKGSYRSYSSYPPRHPLE